MFHVFIDRQRFKKIRIIILAFEKWAFAWKFITKASVISSKYRTELIEVVKLTQKYFFLEKIFAEHRYKHLTISKNLDSEQSGGATVIFHADTTLDTEMNEQLQIDYPTNLDGSKRTRNISQPLIISLTIFFCILSLSLGLLVTCIVLKKKIFSRKEKSNRMMMIFVVENNATCLWESVDMLNKKWVDSKYYDRD